MKALNKFQRGSGCFICAECGKRTRQTLRNNANTIFCADCIEKMEKENEVNDDE